MHGGSTNNLEAIAGLVSELKRCDEGGITTAAIAMAFICIDTLANLARSEGKQRVTRADFKSFVDEHLQAHPDQPYQYRGKDVYAARCAFLHTYGSESELHSEDADTVKFGYHNGGKHLYKLGVDPRLVLIGTKSFVNGFVHAVDSFLAKCQVDSDLRSRVESRLDGVLQASPYPREGHT